MPSVKGSPTSPGGVLLLKANSLKAEDYQTDESESQEGGSGGSDDCNSVEHEYGPA